MSGETKHENANGHGSYERQDLRPAGILYFLLGLAVATLLCILGLRGLFVLLEHREKALQPAVNPLVTNVPTDTRRVAPGYPQNTFPNPKLEEDERGQLNDSRMNEEKELYSYGWVDEKAGKVHIPIERAMDLLVQRGLPVRSEGVTSENAAPRTGSDNRKSSATRANKKGAKK
jgi:hypothetical protein